MAFGLFGKSKNGKLSQSASQSDATRFDLPALESNVELSNFLLACERGDISTVRSILRKYDDEHVTEERELFNLKRLEALLTSEDTQTHKTALMYACVGGHARVVEELLNYGADVETTHDGSTPLYHAASRGHIETVSILLRYSAHVNAMNSKGWTALMNAAYFGHEKIVQLLLQYKADPDVKRVQFDGKTALHFAAKNARFSVIELLLDYGADPNILDFCDEKYTPLMYAVQKGHLPLIQLLILYGADPCITTALGHKAIDFIELQSQRKPAAAAASEQADASDDDDDGDAEDVMAINGHSHDMDDVDDDEHAQSLKSQQQNLYMFMQQSEHIHASFCKLINPAQMRVILKHMNSLHNSFPYIRDQIQQVQRISDLYQIEEREMNTFLVLCTDGVKRCLATLKPYDAESESHDDGDHNNEYQSILDAYKTAYQQRTQKCNTYKADAAATDGAIETMDRQLVDRNQQIAVLQRQLQQCESEQRNLTQQLSFKRLQSQKVHRRLARIQHRLSMDETMFDVMLRATNNVKSVCEKAEKLPLQYRRDLQSVYQRKQKQLEVGWRDWSLADIIVWICGLDRGGRFKKYATRLLKLQELEEEEDHGDDGDEDEDEDEEKDESDQEERHNGVTPAHEHDEQEHEEGVNDVTQEQSQSRPTIANNGVLEQRQKPRVKRAAILEQINGTVLRMCGVRDAHDRKVILMHIESLRTQNDGVVADAEMSGDNMSEKVAEVPEIMQVFDAEGDVDHENMELIPTDATAEIAVDDDKSDCDSQQKRNEKHEEHLNAVSDDNKEMEHLHLDGRDSGDEELSSHQKSSSLAIAESKFMCPLSRTMMKDPVICADGFSYERDAIERWLQNNEVSPMTKQTLTTKQLFPNQNLKSMINEHLQFNK